MIYNKSLSMAPLALTIEADERVGSKGDVVTKLDEAKLREDLLYMLQRSGYETGVSLDAAIATGHWLQEQLGRPVPGMLVKAGSFPRPTAPPA